MGAEGLGVFGVSETGSLAYLSGALRPELDLSWVDRQGVEQSIPTPSRPYGGIRLSPDGGRIAMQVVDITGVISVDDWVYDLERRTFNKVTFEGIHISPVWSTDGKRLIHTSGTMGGVSLCLTSSAADSSGEPIPLWEDNLGFLPSSLSSGGVLIGNRPAASPGNRLPGNQLAVLQIDPGGTSATGELEPFLDARFLRTEAQFSPDGKLVAFQSDQTGVNEIYVVPYPGPGGIVQISNSGGTQPRWNRNGRSCSSGMGTR